MGRVVTSVSIDETLYHLAKEKGISFSQVLNEALERVLKVEKETDALIKIACRKLMLSKKVEERAKNLLRGVNIGKKDPKVLVASAIYIACNSVGERRTQREIGRILGISEAIIRKRYKELIG